MRTSLQFILIAVMICCSTLTILAQEKLEVIGKAKITTMDVDNAEDDIVVVQPDGTLAKRDASTLGGSGGGSILNVGQPFMSSSASNTWCGLGFCSGTDQRRASFVAPRSGTLKNLFVFPNQLPAEADGEVTVTVWVNNSSTALQAVYSVDVEGLNPASNTAAAIAVAQGDIITTRFESTGVNMTNAANMQTTFLFE